MKIFKSILQRSGMSQTEAAEYLDVSLASVKNWSRGSHNPPQGVFDEFHELLDKISDTAYDVFHDWLDDQEADALEIFVNVYIDENGMKKHGWQNVSSQMAMAAEVFVKIGVAGKVTIVEKGEYQ